MWFPDEGKGLKTEKKYSYTTKRKKGDMRIKKLENSDAPPNHPGGERK